MSYIFLSDSHFVPLPLPKKAKMELPENVAYADNYVNLREDVGGLAVMGELAPVSDDYIDEPEFFHIERGDGYNFAVWQPADGNLIIIDSESNTRHVAFIAERPVDVISIDDRSLEVVTDTRSILYEEIDDEWIATELPDSYPVAEISATDSLTVSADVDRRKLSGTPGSARFEASVADCRNATSDFLDAYSAIRRKANNAGRFIQPLFVRYRLLDKSDNLLHVSPPILIEGPTENVLSKQLVFDSESPAIEKHTVEANAFALAIKFDGTPDDRVAAMIVDTTPEIDRIDFDGRVVLRQVSDSLTGGSMIRIDAPRLSANACSTLIAGMADNLERLFTPVARIERPFSTRRHSVTLERLTVAPETDYKAVSRRLGSLETVGLSPDETLLRSISPPHSFTSEISTFNGPAILYAGLKVRRFAGYDIRHFICGTSDVPWRAAITVEFSGGDETVVQTSEGSANAPLSLVPMLSYPSSDATAMTISLRRGDVNFRRRFTLTHSVGQNLSYYLSPDMNPITFDGFETDSYIIPAAVGNMKTLPGVVASAKTSDPRNPVSALTAQFSKVNACTAADGNSSGWENSKSRFLIFTSSGIHKATIDSKGRLGQLNRIHNATVARRSAVAVTPDFGTMALTSGGDILKIKGTAVSPVGRGDGTMLAYDRRNRELWIAGGTMPHRCLVRHMPSGRYSTRRLPAPFQAAANSPAGSVAVIGNRLYDISGEEKKGTVEMSLTVAVSLSPSAPPGVRRTVKTQGIRSIEIDMSSPEVVDMTVDIRVCHGNGTDKSSPLAKFNLSGGSVDSPLLLNVASPPVRSVAVTLSGRMAAGSVIQEIYFNKKP